MERQPVSDTAVPTWLGTNSAVWGWRVALLADKRLTIRRPLRPNSSAANGRRTT